MDTAAVWNKVALLVPALKPDDKLITLLQEMASLGAQHVVVVDDGSGEAYAPLFAEANALGAVVLTHRVNMGKGRALKTGFNYLLGQSGLVGVVTADADGQHLPKDITACAEALLQHPDSLVMGCRDFSESQVPFKSRAGNIITRNVMAALCGVRTTDTQTGLRAVPFSFMRRLITVPGERFEFETNMLLETRTSSVPLAEVPITTVYYPGNPSSHFNPLLDAARIYLLFIKFMAASLTSALTDIVLFTVFSHLFGGLGLSVLAAIPLATFLARVVSATLNYLLSRKAFESRRSVGSAGMRYFVLAAAQMLCSAGLVAGLHLLMPAIHETGIKVVVDALLFFVSFHLQRRFVF